MLDIPSLERKWLRYKIKYFLPYIAILLFCLVIFIGFFIFFSSSNITKSKQALEINNHKHQKTVPISASNEVILEPSMQFIQAISPYDLHVQEETKTPQPQKIVPTIQKSILPKPVPHPIEKISPPILSTVIPTLPNTKVNAKKPTMSHDNTSFDIQELEERFKSNSNPHLGLYIARYHYDRGNYNEAYNHALKTNSLNNTLDESWIVFSKSLVKLGKTEQAKKTLQLYISKSNSEEAKALLNSIEQGEFK